MNANRIGWRTAGLAMIAALWMAAGCEEVDTESALGVTPYRSIITGVGTTVYLGVYDPEIVTAVPDAEVDQSKVGGASSTNLSDRVMLPLEWSVSDPGLGRIASSGGYNAVYESYGGDGQNYITAKDQFDRKGVAVVVQRREFIVTTTTSTDEDGEDVGATTTIVTTNADGSVTTTIVADTDVETDESTVTTGTHN